MDVSTPCGLELSAVQPDSSEEAGKWRSPRRWPDATGTPITDVPRDPLLLPSWQLGALLQPFSDLPGLQRGPWHQAPQETRQPASLAAPFGCSEALAQPP